MQTQTAQELDDVIKLLRETDIASLSNLHKDELRSKIIQVQKLALIKLGESSTVDFEESIIKEYCNQLVDYMLFEGKPATMYDEVDSKRTSKRAKQLISEILLQKDISLCKTKVGKNIYNMLMRSSTVQELKFNLKLYKAILETEQEMTDLQEMNTWLSSQLSTYEFEDIALEPEETERMYDLLEQDDEELSIALKAHRMKKEFGISEREAATVLGIPRTNLQRIIKKFKIQDA